MGYRTETLTPEEASNLLQATVFQRRIDDIQAQVAHPEDAPWQPVRDWALQSQTCAVHICEQDPWLRIELLEALHTVVALAQQVADGLKIQAQVQTPTYQQMVQAQLQQSCDRMQQTHAQLQQLQDQVAVASLEANRADTSLPQRLQTLITANKQLLETPRDLS